MKKSDRDALIKGETNEALKDRFIQEVGQKARVDRSAIENEHMDQLREVIRDVGMNLLEVGAAPKGMTYRGSLSVHVYSSEILRSAAFVTLSATENLPPGLADAALRELNGATKVAYGQKRTKLRSGF